MTINERIMMNFKSAKGDLMNIWVNRKTANEGCIAVTLLGVMLKLEDIERQLSALSGEKGA
jgi:hypothetical protein